MRSVSAMGLDGKFAIILMNQANMDKKSRKAWSQQITAFARFHAKHPDTMMICHTFERTVGGIDLPALVALRGVQDSVKSRPLAI